MSAGDLFGPYGWRPISGPWVRKVVALVQDCKAPAFLQP